MAAHIGRLAARQQHFLAAQLFQDFHHAAAGLADLIEVFHAGLIGRLFLVAVILQQHAARHFRPAHHDAHTGLALAGRGDGDGAQHHRQDLRDACTAQLVLQARQMAAGDMAGFVRDHPHDLVGVVGAHQQPGIQEQVLPAGDEGVDIVAIDDEDADIVRLQPCRREQWRRIVADGIFDFRIANQAHARCHRRQRRACNDDRQDYGDQNAKFLKHYSVSPRPALVSKWGSLSRQ